MKPRVIGTIRGLASQRRNNLLEIFHPIAQRSKKININQRSSKNNLIFGISDGNEEGINYTEWRFRTFVENITANYHEVWINLEKDKYFLEKSYLHLYNFDHERSAEIEYIFLHCDACEPENAPHSIYKQSPHIHVKVATDPIPKAHFALYNGRTTEILSSIQTYNKALLESVQLLNSEVLQLH